MYSCLTLFPFHILQIGKVICHCCVASSRIWKYFCVYQLRICWLSGVTQILFCFERGVWKHLKKYQNPSYNEAFDGHEDHEASQADSCSGPAKLGVWKGVSEQAFRPRERGSFSSLFHPLCFWDWHESLEYWKCCEENNPKGHKCSWHRCTGNSHYGSLSSLG